MMLQTVVGNWLTLLPTLLSRERDRPDPSRRRIDDEEIALLVEREAERVERPAVFRSERRRALARGVEHGDARLRAHEDGVVGAGEEVVRRLDRDRRLGLPLPRSVAREDRDPIARPIGDEETPRVVERDLARRL